MQATLKFLFWFAAFCVTPSLGICQQNGFLNTIRDTQPKIVKITGSGGFQGLAPHQSGFLISEDGAILTAWSYVLDTEKVLVTLDDGQRYEASLTGYDPRLEIAVLKISGDGFSCFDLERKVRSYPGKRVLAFSNLFGIATGNESASVQHGVISAKTNLRARQGAFESAYRGPVFILDAITNNPGAAGGAVTNRNGQLIGMIGKEVRDSQTNSWLNFAIPIEALKSSVREIRTGKKIVDFNEQRRKPSEPMTLKLLGVILVPNVVDRTPPFIDQVVPDSFAKKSGLEPDDLIVEINGRLTPTHQSVLAQLSQIDRDAPLTLTIERKKTFKTIEIRLVN